MLFNKVETKALVNPYTKDFWCGGKVIVTGLSTGK